MPNDSTKRLYGLEAMRQQIAADLRRKRPKALRGPKTGRKDSTPLIKSIIDYLNLRWCPRGWEHPSAIGGVWRQNSGKAVGRHFKSGSMFSIVLAPEGSPDITGVMPGGCRLEIEVKCPGDKLRPRQEDRIEFLRRSGVLVVTMTPENWVRECESLVKGGKS